MANRFRYPIIALVAALMLSVAASAEWALRAQAIADSIVVAGPIASSGPPGHPQRDYVFYSTPMDLAKAGYVEEEYFVAGTATRYSITADAGEPKNLGDIPYRTRIVVRKPRDAGRFSGVVVVDWQNVTAGYDADVEWGQAGAFFVRAGWAWVGASVQRIGVHGFDPPNRLAGRGLKQWSPERYASLDVTAGGSVSDDSQSYDIYSQVARLVRRTTGGVFNGLAVRRVYAAGASQSASYVVRYYNSLQRSTKAFDAFMVTIGGGAPRLDEPAKLMKVYTEGEVARFMAGQRVADTSTVRTWEIAGAPHVGTALMSADPNEQAVLGGLLGREMGAVSPVSARQCSRPHPSTVEGWLIHRAAYAALDRWVTGSVPPPVGDGIKILKAPAPDGSATIARDMHGIALGGIRLPRVAVPTALNSGENQPANAAPENAFCRLYGAHVPFEPAVLTQLYPTESAYLRDVRAVVDELVSGGFVLRDDAALLIANAQSDFRQIGKVAE